ncbi:putative LRR receptor-like serine/threonine-protein kinase [Ananas comosus]|uniref:Putative LRR receptor-like serine/threonine-protein kinase n=1 Tax=Ananas comosus TaxID=4615 RepID=A0A199VSV1_ANACO|nr:putative LRR receptor-like serine/threonine-protein kinase [Ananas comosus]
MNYENADIVAVKVLNLQQHGAFRSFISIRHRNLVKILTSCSSLDHRGNDFKALVFEYMPNGSLEESLSLIQRLNIEYLHHEGSVLIVHCDLKPSNVLLDNDMTAHVGDFGVHLPILWESKDLLAMFLQYGMGCKPSRLGDVYSYGILLLEMFTGMSPVDDKFKDGLSLRGYVHAAAASLEHLMDIMDRNLHSVDNDVAYREECVRDCVVSVFNCGLSCSNESPYERCDMTKVSNELTKSNFAPYDAVLTRGK